MSSEPADRHLAARGRASVDHATLEARSLRLTRVRLAQVPGNLGTGRAYDLRPGPADLAPAHEAAGRANGLVLLKSRADLRQPRALKRLAERLETQLLQLAQVGDALLAVLVARKRLFL